MRWTVPDILSSLIAALCADAILSASLKLKKKTSHPSPPSLTLTLVKPFLAVPHIPTLHLIRSLPLTPTPPFSAEDLDSDGAQARLCQAPFPSLASLHCPPGSANEINVASSCPWAALWAWHTTRRRTTSNALLRTRPGENFSGVDTKYEHQVERATKQSKDILGMRMFSS